MPNIEKKQAVVAEIKENLNNAVSVVLVNARGLTVAKDSELRKKLRESGIFYKVYKNTMLKFAIKDSKFEPLIEYLNGPTAVAISYDDATASARIMNKEMQDEENFQFKAAVIDSVFYDTNGVNAIANIPPREELLAKLLGSLKSPMASFARVIKAIAEKKCCLI